MNPRVIDVIPNDDYTLTLTFKNGEVKIFDVKPYLDISFFTELKNISYFKCVRVINGIIGWTNGQNFCPDNLYIKSIVL